MGQSEQTQCCRILDYVQQIAGKDDDEIASALAIHPRQTVNKHCRDLAERGLIERRPGSSGKLCNFPMANDAQSSEPNQIALAPPASETSDVTREWYWEGNIASSLQASLSDRGWETISLADTRSRARGVDLHMRLGDTELIIEVKGYPSSYYRDPARRNEVKPTPPTNQATHWYSQALLKAITSQRRFPSAISAVAFPDLPRYRRLYEETAHGLEGLGLATFFVSAHGEIEQHGKTCSFPKAHVYSRG